ncbi:MAG: protein-L-isoaspartate O-methyltransferase [Betaproteobacteria bacterium]|nr:protein-L-isoaspartate O-methyltransferase [Betaproteobacteria bacterium]
MEHAQNLEQARFNMVEQQIRPWEVLDQEVLDLLFVVKREAFVPAAYQALAFADLEIPLASGASMLAPKIEARLLQELGLKKTDKVLEIGTGSGYMAALLAARADQVTTVEINAELAKTAKANLVRAGVSNVSVETGDGARGWGKETYDVIVISGSLPFLPESLLKQLKVGGRLVAIVGELPVMEAQLVTCTAEGTYASVNLFETVAVPLQNAPQRDNFRF